MSAGFRPRTPDSATQHRDWLDLVETSGPFLSLPVLRRTWPSLDALDRPVRDTLRARHATWLADPAAGRDSWVDYVLRELLGWDELLRTGELDAFSWRAPEHDTTVTPDFLLAEPGTGTPALLGMVCDGAPSARVAGSEWSATPADRMARLCRVHDVPLGLVTDGRAWTLVWAPRANAERPAVTATATFDAMSWPEAAERHVLRAFRSLLCRTRFFAVPEAERLPALFEASLDSQEEITEALGVQVRQAVELLVAALGRVDVAARARGEDGLRDVDAHEVYEASVTVMMRVVFLLFAEERGLLPAGNELYERVYSAGRLCAELEQRAIAEGEHLLEDTTIGWSRLLALFTAVHEGVAHPRLTVHPHDGSLFDTTRFPWLPLTIDDRTVLHMLRAVQYVRIGTGKSAERRALSFRTLDVEQIGYVYEGLLGFEGFRADAVILGLVGKEGAEAEARLDELERLAAGREDAAATAKALAEAYKGSKIGSAKALAKRLSAVDEVETEERRKKLLAVTGKDPDLAARLLPFYGVLRQDLRGLPLVIMPGALYVTESALRANTGTHYTPRFLAEQVVEGALEPLVYEPGPLATAEKSEWTLRSSGEILALKVADIAMGSAAFLVAAARYLGDRLVEAWVREGTAAAPQHDVHSPETEDDPLVTEARRRVIEHCLYGVDINPMAVEMAKLSLWLVSMDARRPFTFLDDRLVAGDSLLGIISLEQLRYMHMDPTQARHIQRLKDPQLLDGVRQVVSEVSQQRRKLTEIDGDTVDGLARKRELLSDAEDRTKRATLLADLAVGAALAKAGRGERGLADGAVAAADWARRVDGAEAEARREANRWLRTDLVPGGFDRHTVHWPLVFPEVFENGGFDAIIGNPPFLGGSKISGASGASYREYLVEAIAGGSKGNADLIAYFVLRAHALLASSGQAGLIATNTLAQGDTRDVSLDQLTARGVTIRQSIKSAKWPTNAAALEYCAIWTSRSEIHENAQLIADDSIVSGITSSLTPVSRVSGAPNRLSSSAGIAIYATYVLGLGFTMTEEQATDLIAKDPINADVLYPYILIRA